MRRRIAILIAALVTSSSCTALGFPGGCGGIEIIGYFEQVGDLVAAANVQAADVEIGTVEEIELDGWSARVTMCLDEGERIPADVHAEVRTTSLLGEKFIDLKPQSTGPPYLEDGDTLELDQTSKATELEDVFAKLAAVLGTGNLEQINRFTTAQAKILRNRAGEVREVLERLRRFTGTLAERKGDIAAALDSLDSVSQTIIRDSDTLENFLESFADSSGVLADQEQGLQSLVVALDRFSRISAQLLRQTESGMNRSFANLRPVLRTIVANSANVRETLQTLATFSQWFPESMPGDYLQLDVCQAAPEHYEPGTTCPQAQQNDDPDAARAGSGAGSPASGAPATNSVEYLLRLPLQGASG